MQTIYLFDLTLPLRHPVALFGVLLLVVLVVPALFQRLRLPGIVGLILAGALLGPFGTNLLDRGEGMQLLSQVGLLYLMFWAGLEINMASFIKNKHKSLAFGLLTFALPLTLGGFAARYLLGFDWMGALLLASMFSTHTLISYPIVNRLRISQDEAVAITVGGTIITDTLALLMLAVISGMARGELTGWFWAKLAFSLTLFGIVVFGILPRVARWFFQKVESDLTYQYVFVLALVFTCGLLAELAGVEAIIGAFMAGLLLNRLIPHTSPLMERIEFVGNALFIPAFLFSVGMLVNLQVFFMGSGTILTALLLTAIALLTKWAAAFATQKIYGYSAPQRNLIFGLSSSHAAATIAIILIGYEVKLFDEQVLNATVFLILATCLVSTLVTDRTARHIVSQQRAATPDLPDLPQRILVPFSNPDTVAALFDFVFLIKNPDKPEPVRPLSVILDERDVREKMAESRHLMEPVLRHAAERKVPVSPIYRVDVNAVSGILRAAKELTATDIVIGWHPVLSATEKLFGTLQENLLEESASMLFVTHFTRPVAHFNRLKIVLPPQAQLEPRFPELVHRLELAAAQLDAEVHLLATPGTAAAFRQLISPKTNDLMRATDLAPDDWWSLHELLHANELPVLVSARREGVSHENFMERLPGYLSENFDKKSFVLVYPAF